MPQLALIPSLRDTVRCEIMQSKGIPSQLLFFDVPRLSFFFPNLDCTAVPKSFLATRIFVISGTETVSTLWTVTLKQE